MDFNSVLKAGAIAMPVIAGVIGYFVKLLLAQVLSRLEVIETKLDVAAEHRGKIEAQVDSFAERLDRFETRLDRML